MKTNLKIMGMILATMLLAACGDYGSGEKLGRITKLNQQGTICKSWEGEIIRGGMNNGSGAFGAPFQFTVEDPVVLKQVQAAFDKQQEVKITYHMERASWCRSDSDSHFLTSITILSDAPEAPVSGTSSSGGNEGTIRAIVRDEIRKAFSEK